MKKYKILIFLFILTHLFNAQVLNGSFESKFKRYQKNESFTGTPSKNWNAVAWKGERISKQIILWSNSDINSLTYTISDLKNGVNSIKSSDISLKFGVYIKGDPEPKTCSAYPTHDLYVELIDALSDTPINRITSSDPIKLWAFINVPTDAVAGTYNGTITVNGASSPVIFNIELKIVNYTLPKVSDWKFHLDLWQFPENILNIYNNANSNSAPVSVWSDKHFSLFEPAYQLLADTGQKAITTYIKDGALGAPSMVRWIKKTDGTWSYDFTGFDKYVSKLMSLGINKQINCFSLVGWNENVIPYWDEASNSKIDLSAPLGSAIYTERWNHFLTEFKKHLDSKNWFDKTVIYMDEVPEEKLTSAISVVQNNNANWKLGIAYSHELSDNIRGEFYDTSGIVEIVKSNKIQKNNVSTFYTSCTQIAPNNYVTPKNNLSEMTWMSWHAMNKNLDGYLRWAYDYWRLWDPFDIRDGAHTAGDFAFIYRTSNTAPQYLPSLRLVMLREGIQDFEKTQILKSQLQSSSNTIDKENLKKLNNVINLFTLESGTQAEKVVLQAQKTMEDIVIAENFNLNNIENSSQKKN